MNEIPDDRIPVDADLSVARIEGDVELCRSPVCLALIAYWQDLAARSDNRPLWRDIQLMDLYKIAHYLVVKDVIGNGEDYINRFWGTAVTEGLGFDGTYTRVTAYKPAQMRRTVQRRYDRLVKTSEPEMVRGFITTMPEQKNLPFELVHLPLWGDGEGVRHIISAYHFGFVWPDDFD
tara:strand:+ start:1075 stop:1605 length:531 start_codon:yes stop_codon:yes gene_type:complete